MKNVAKTKRGYKINYKIWDNQRNWERWDTAYLTTEQALSVVRGYGYTIADIDHAVATDNTDASSNDCNVNQLLCERAPGIAYRVIRG